MTPNQLADQIEQGIKGDGGLALINSERRMIVDALRSVVRSEKEQITQAASESADADAPRSQRCVGMAPEVASASGMESSREGGRPSLSSKAAITDGQVRAALAAWFGRNYNHQLADEVQEFVERMRAALQAAGAVPSSIEAADPGEEYDGWRELSELVKACRDLHVSGATEQVVGKIVSALSAYDNIVGIPLRDMWAGGQPVPSAIAQPLQKIAPTCRATSVSMQIKGNDWSCHTCGASSGSPECRWRSPTDGGTTHG